MDDALKYITWIAISLAVIFRTGWEIFRRGGLRKNKAAKTAQVDEDPVINIPQELLKSYRTAIDNSKTTMVCFGYLAAHRDATEDEIIAEVTRSITEDAPAQKKHVRHVLYALIGAGFVGIRGSAWFYVTPLGTRTLESIRSRESEPAVSRMEQRGYRTLLSQNEARRTLLELLRRKYSMSRAALTQEVIDICGRHGSQVTLPGFRMERIISDTAAFGWISDDGNTCKITNLGKQVFDDLQP